MAEFDGAFGKISMSRGLCLESPGDKESETYQGVFRRFYPSWEGWDIIDALKRAASNDAELHRTLEQNERLRNHVSSFYRRNYWDRFWGDRIPSQEVAEEILQISLNEGVRKTVRLLQEALNVLSGSEERYAEIEEDGLLGPKTAQALEGYLTVEGPSSLIKLLRILQGVQYVERLRQYPGQRKYAKSWLSQFEIPGMSEKTRIPTPPTNLRVD